MLLAIFGWLTNLQFWNCKLCISKATHSLYGIEFTRRDLKVGISLLDEGSSIPLYKTCFVFTYKSGRQNELLRHKSLHFICQFRFLFRKILHFLATQVSANCLLYTNLKAIKANCWNVLFPGCVTIILGHTGKLFHFYSAFRANPLPFYGKSSVVDHLFFPRRSSV